MSPVRFISLFYFAMAALGLGLIAWRKKTFETDPLALPNETWPIALAATVAIIGAVHLLSRLATAKIPALARGTDDLRRLLGNLTSGQIAIVALASGIGEEFLFRGWLYHETGLWISSILFGLVHIPPNRQWLYWPFFAIAMGVVLGWLYGWSGTLVFPILLHAGVNFLNLRLALRKNE